MPTSNPNTRPLRWALAALSLSMLLSSLGTSIANVALPTLAAAFSASFQQVQWIVLAYLLAITTVIVSAGRLGDMVGRRRLLMAGLAVFSAASLLCGLAPALWLMILARAVQGFGAAVMMALTMAFVGETVPRERTGSAMGLLGTMSAVGTALGPTLGGLLIAVAGWRAIFLLNVPLGLLAIVLAWRFLPADQARTAGTRARFDHPGTLLLAVALAAYALALTLRRGQMGPLNLALLCLGFGAAGQFLRVESRAAFPLMPLSLFRSPVASGGFAMSALVTTVVMTTLVVGPFYLAGALGLDAAGVGMAMSAGPIVSALAGVPSGRLVDRFGAHRMAQAGLAAMLCGCAALALFAPGRGVAAYVTPLVLTTAGYALFQAANNTAVMSDSGPEQKGVIGGMLSLSRNLGLITGASLMGAVFALEAATGNMAGAGASELVAGMQLAFAVAAVLIGIALAIAAAVHALARRAAGTGCALVQGNDAS